MNPISRRQMLAATAAAGLLTTTAVVNAQSGPFRSRPGDGGYGRQAFELPPGGFRGAQARVYRAPMLPIAPSVGRTTTRRPGSLWTTMVSGVLARSLPRPDRHPSAVRRDLSIEQRGWS